MPCYLCVCVCSGALRSPFDGHHLVWSEDLMSACVVCGLCVEDCCGVLSERTAQQNELHSGFHTELSWLDSLRASAKITLVRISLCMAGYVQSVCVCTFVYLGEEKEVVGVIHLAWWACNVVVKATDTSTEHGEDEGWRFPPAISKQIISPLYWTLPVCLLCSHQYTHSK